jgi:hypothetical protein
MENKYTLQELQNRINGILKDKSGLSTPEVVEPHCTKEGFAINEREL